MTNKEYFEKNNISFADALKEYDADRDGSVESWLYAERIQHNFEVGDILNWNWNNRHKNYNSKFLIIEIDEEHKCYYGFVFTDDKFRTHDINNKMLLKVRNNTYIFYLPFGDEKYYKKVGSLKAM